MTICEEIDELSKKLATERDELRLQAHLLSAEMRDEWQKVEGIWDSFQDKARQVRHSGMKTGEEVLDATKDLGKDVAKAYKRIREAL